ncbi:MULTISPECIES: hypothetical protein [Gordonia]|nr:MULTISPECIES: hypothetical protein [Gordonia]
MLDARCTALLLGVDASDLAGGQKLSESAVRSGIRRRKEYEAATGNTEPDMLGVLSHYARREGVTLIVDGVTVVD